MVEGRVQRRLAAILAADVAGYSRLMGENEEATLATFKTYFEVIDGLIADHRGRKFGGAGDSVITEFASPVEAVRCATEIQLKINQRNAELPEERRMHFRIGVNLGDVMVEGENLLGDGVNVAARLQAIAPVNGVCISRKVYDEIKGKLDLAFEDLGERSLKNIAEPVHVYSLILGAETEDPVRSDDTRVSLAVAVLPFENMSHDPEQDYFADGLTEDLITALSGWRTLPVIARNSVFTYKGRAATVQEIARDLGARYVVEGSVRRAADRLRISVQLVDASTGHHIWAEKFDRAAGDLFDVQDEITQRVAATVAPEVEMDIARHLRGKPTQDLDAWDYYQKGMAALRRRDEASARNACHTLEKATQLDPNYAQAFSALAASVIYASSMHWLEPRAEAAKRAVEAAQRAASLDPRDASIRVTLGVALAHARQYERAIAELERALELNPNNAFAYAHLGCVLEYMGKPEAAIEQLDEAVRISPQRDPRADPFLTWLARAYMSARRYVEAATWIEKAIHRRPDYAEAYATKAAVLGHLGRREDGQAALEECERISPDFLEKRAAWRYYRKPDDEEHFFAGLRLSGWGG